MLIFQGVDERNPVGMMLDVNLCFSWISVHVSLRLVVMPSFFCRIPRDKCFFRSRRIPGRGASPRKKVCSLCLSFFLNEGGMFCFCCFCFCEVSLFLF